MSSAPCGRASFGRALCIALGTCFLFVTSGLCAAAGESEELSGLCRLDSLPQDIRGSLSRNFSAWRIQEPTDLSIRARTRWGAERPLTCPGIAVGHFQDPKGASYAVLLIPANHSSDAYKLLVYTAQSGQQYYGFKAVGAGDNGGGDVFVSSVPTTRFFDATSKWVAHSRITEAVMLVDSAAIQAFLYLWSDTAYERTQVNYQ
jgi:hypothetical protein